MATPPAPGTRSTLAETLRDSLLELVSIPSPSGSERALADRLERRLGQLPGTRLLRVENNLLLRFDGTHGKPRVLLCGHLDTVPAQGDAGPRIDGDRVHGTGASDLKAGLAVLLHLAETLVIERCTLDPVLAFYSNEEVEYDRSGLIELDRAGPWLREAELAICVEPTFNRVEVGCLGTLHAEIELCGTAAHSARPWLGHNAIHAAAPILHRIGQTPERTIETPGWPDVVFHEVAGVTRIEGGGARNIVPDRCLLNLNFRFGPDRTSQDACSWARDLVGSAGRVRFHDVAPSGKVALDNPLCKRLLDQVGSPPAATQAWTDVGRFSEWGIDAVSFGPGLPEQAHREGEYASVAAMVKSYHDHRCFLES